MNINTISVLSVLFFCCCSWCACNSRYFTPALLRFFSVKCGYGYWTCHKSIKIQHLLLCTYALLLSGDDSVLAAHSLNSTQIVSTFTPDFRSIHTTFGADEGNLAFISFSNYVCCCCFLFCVFVHAPFLVSIGFKLHLLFDREKNVFVHFLFISPGENVSFPHFWDFSCILPTYRCVC